MFATPAYAQAVGGAAASGNPTMDMIMNIAPLILLAVAGYFLLLRPQSQRAKAQQAKLGGIKRGDTVVLTSGVIGQVTRVEDTELAIDISKGVEVKVVKSMVADVRVKGQPVAANDTKR